MMICIQKLVLFLAVLLVIVSTGVAEVKLDLQVSDSSLELGDEMTVQLKADGAEDGATLILPNIDGLSFRQLGRPSSSSQTIIVNGKINRFSGLIFSIGIGADKKGFYNIPGIGIRHQNQEYTSKPFSLRVVSPNVQSSMKVTLAASRKQLFPDEPLIITLKWYLQDSVQDYTFRFPLLAEKDHLQLKLASEKGTGATRELTVSGYTVPFQQGVESVAGEQYTVYQTALQIFPSEAGTLHIPAASVKAMVKRGTELKRDFFDRLVRTPKLQRIFAVSDGLNVIVKELPIKGRPPDFTGGIGQFEIQLSTEQTRVRIGDPVELSIRIAGRGRFSKIQQPLLNDIAEYKENFVIVDSLQPGDILEDSISFRQVVRARSEKVTRIPPVRFSYFDPVLQKYMTITSNDIPIKVLASRQITAADIIVPDAKTGEGSQTLLKQNRGIYGNYIFEDALSSQDQNPAWLMLLLLPPAIWLVVFIVVRRRRQLNNDQALVRSRGAKSKSSRHLKKARTLLAAENNLFLAELSGTLSGYISDKFNLGAGGVTAFDVRLLIQTHNLSESLAEELIGHFEQFDRLRFSSRDVSLEERQSILADVEQSLKTLEKQL